MQKISIIIPAYNEEQRIKRTLCTYIAYFDQLKDEHTLDYEILVALNGCKDGTINVVQEIEEKSAECLHVDLKEAGKGLAIKAGFANALTRHNDLIGFVDADMATSPEAFYDLIRNIDSYDGIIASRYIEGAKIYPPRPWVKRWGSRLIYEPLVRILLGISYKDFQCGAKIFKRDVIQTIAPHMVMTKWAFDVEILYLCKKYGFKIRECPTEWYDQAGSKLNYASGFKMLGSIIKLRLRNSIFKNLVS